MEIMVQRVGQEWPIEGGYRLELIVRRDARKRDLDNSGLKAVQDALVRMAIISDDSLAEEIVLRWGKVAGCEVRVESVT